MSEKSFPRPEFDPRYEFLTLRQFLISGKPIEVNLPFDKTLVSVRTLRQLYESRYLAVDTSKPMPDVAGRKWTDPGPVLPAHLMADLNQEKPSAPAPTVSDDDKQPLRAIRRGLRRISITGVG